MQKKDFYIVTIVGALIGLFALIPVRNIASTRGVFFEMPVLLGIVFGCILFAPLALFILKLLSHRFPIFEKFGKFAAVGTLNTMLDLSILNWLTLLFGVSTGFAFFGFKAISFLIGTTNSYGWNKFWTFQSTVPVNGKEYIRFALFTLFGAVLNASVAFGVRSVIGDSLAEGLAVNLAGLAAVAVSFMVNFLNYNNFVFKKKVGTPPIA
jgi:putative flippase GtrA